MFSLRFGLLALLSLASLSASAPTVDSESDLATQKPPKCHDGPYMIIAHGTGNTGEGGFKPMAQAVKQQIPNAGSTGFKYPSETFHYPNSESKGVHHMKHHIRQYIKHCGGKVMLLGYSQGAQIVSDVMGGGTYKQSPHVPGGYSRPLEDKYRKHVVAVLQFGDVGFTIGHPWDAGTSKKSGMFPRTKEQLKHIKKYKGMMRSYCDKGDPYCASGKKDQADYTVHETYFDRYMEDGVNFLVKQWHQRKND